MKRFVPLFLIFLMFLSCNDYRRQMAEQIMELEEEIMADFDAEKSVKLIDAYDKFIEKFPEDSTNKGFLIKAAEVSILSEDAEKALKYLNLFLERYPDDKRAGNVQFKKAIVYDVLVHDPVKAASEYELFLKKYPDNPNKAEAESALLLIRDPEAFTNMIIGNDSIPVDTVSGVVDDNADIQ